MQYGVKQLLEYKLGATDGEIGRVKDFYFDDKYWVVRYLVADTGSWMRGREVLISPYALGHISTTGRLLEVNLTRNKVEKSPSIDTHRPVSRQHEEEFYKYYNWPVYWGGPGIWGLDPAPLIPPSYDWQPRQTANDTAEQPDSHLRSTTEVTGYAIQATDGEIGRVEDFLIDDSTWAIESLVVATGHWWSGKSLLVPPKAIQRVSWEESKVFVNLSRATVAAEPKYVHSPAEQDDHDPRIFK
jgi:sporulation protein YlmC with PRC-barrel domain